MDENLKLLSIDFKGGLMELPATGQTVLYKYFGPPVGKETFAESNLQNLIIKNQVRLSCNLEVNDPADSTPYIDDNYTDKDLKIYLKHLVINPSHSETTEEMRRDLAATFKNRNDRRIYLKQHGLKLAETVLNESKKDFLTGGFTCMTGVWTNRLMWSHYAQSHKGMCVGFRTRPREGETAIPFAGNLLPVKYVSERPVWSMKSMLRGEAQDKVFRASVLQKDDVWKYEKEWRFLTEIHANARPYKGGDIIKIEPDEITEIIFGMRSSDQTKTKINKMLAKSGKRPNLFQTKFKEKSFELIRTSI